MNQALLMAPWKDDFYRLCKGDSLTHQHIQVAQGVPQLEIALDEMTAGETHSTMSGQPQLTIHLLFNFPSH
jgi:hypothetical protein